MIQPRELFLASNGYIFRTQLMETTEIDPKNLKTKQVSIIL